MKHYYICVAVLLVSALLIVVPVSAQADTVCALETCTITLPSYFYYSCYNGSYDSVALDAVGKTAGLFIVSAPGRRGVTLKPV